MGLAHFFAWPLTASLLGLTWLCFLVRRGGYSLPWVFAWVIAILPMLTCVVILTPFLLWGDPLTLASPAIVGLIIFLFGQFLPLAKDFRGRTIRSVGIVLVAWMTPLLIVLLLIEISVRS